MNHWPLALLDFLGLSQASDEVAAMVILMAIPFAGIAVFGIAAVLATLFDLERNA